MKANVLCLEVKFRTNLLEGKVLPGVPLYYWLALHLARKTTA